MEDVEMVDYDPSQDHDEDMISGNTSFYGDETEKSRLNALTAGLGPSTYRTNAHISFGALAAMNCAPVSDNSNPANAAFAPSSTSNHPAPQALYNRHEGNLSARQLSESVDDFLARLPPSHTVSSQYGPWIWIANPYASQRLLTEDWAGFTSDGEDILSNWATTKGTIENHMNKKGKFVSVISKKINILKKCVEENLHDLAKQNNCTAGKWMLFPSSSLNLVWKTVATATAAGELGMDAKVATMDDVGGDTNRARLICIYTYDFSDMQDVLHVLLKIQELGLLENSDGGIYYKCDAYTHLGISSGNPWGLKASLYSSKEMLASATGT